MSWSNAGSGAVSGAELGSSLGPIGMGVGAGVGALIGAFTGNKKTPEQLASEAILKNVPTLIQKGNTATDTGLGQLGQAGGFYSTLLGGNRDALANLLGPQTSTVLSQYDNAAKTVKEFGARGGGSTQQLAANPFQKATALAGGYQAALPGAASGLADVGKATAGIGTTLTGQATNSLSSSQDINNAREARQAEQNKTLGKGFGQIFANILTKKKGGGGGGGGFDTGEDF